jgi:hypothetical protein
MAAAAAPGRPAALHLVPGAFLFQIPSNNACISTKSFDYGHAKSPGGAYSLLRAFCPYVLVCRSSFFQSSKPYGRGRINALRCLGPGQKVSPFTPFQKIGPSGRPAPFSWLNGRGSAFGAVHRSRSVHRGAYMQGVPTVAGRPWSWTSLSHALLRCTVYTVVTSEVLIVRERERDRLGRSMDERRNRRIQALVTMGMRSMEEDGLTPEDLRESLQRYILFTWGGSVNTVASYLNESLARIEHERERRVILQGT